MGTKAHMDDGRCTTKGKINCGATDRCREQQEVAVDRSQSQSIHGTSETTRATQQTGLRRSRGSSLHSEPALGPNKQTRHKRWGHEVRHWARIDSTGAFGCRIDTRDCPPMAAMQNRFAFSRKNRLGFHLTRRTAPSFRVPCRQTRGTNRAGRVR